jgi:formylglycine-generating enzyme required for sulfatase activity
MPDKSGRSEARPPRARVRGRGRIAAGRTEAGRIPADLARHRGPIAGTRLPQPRVRGPRPAQTRVIAAQVAARLVAILAAIQLAGCGAQDLYKPPHSPYQVTGRVALPSAAQDVDILGNYAFVAGGEAGLLVIDISDPHAPALVHILDTVKFAESIRVASTPGPAGVIDIAFVVEGTEGITTYDVTDPPNAFSFQQGTTAVDGNGLFIEMGEDPSQPYKVYLAENWKGMRIFESDPQTPGLLRYNGVFSSTRGYAKSVAVQNGFAYVADDEMGVAVLDVRTPVLGAVGVVSSCDTPGTSRGIAVEGNHLYVADGENGLVVMQMTDEGDPLVPVPAGVATLPLPGVCRAIEVRDHTAFIAAQDGGLHTVDVSSPASPRLLGTVVTSYATGVAVSKTGVVVVSDRDEGVVVLQGPAPFSDNVPPAKVIDLSAAPVDSTTIRLTWRAPGDDGLTGTAASYDVRYSGEPIETDADGESAAQAEGEPAPSRAGSTQSFDVTDLLPTTEYFFALRAADAEPNWSARSNVASAVTPRGNVAPVLENGSVSPPAGTPATSFVFEVTYRDNDGDAPTEATVHLLDAAFDMVATGSDYESGVVYRYETTLAVGAYEHFFSFNDGHHGSVTTEVETGPWIGNILFEMGSPEDEPGRDADETLHPVVLGAAPEISDHEVTQAEYEAVMGTNPSRFQGPDLPVERVSWYDAIRYCNARSEAESLVPAYTIEGETVTWNQEADGYRLPTEAEWEWACRAGSGTAFSGGDLTEEACGFDPVLDALGWYCGNAAATTHEVKTKQPNAFGLYDLHGNVWEWCWDWYRADLGTAVAVDPLGPPGGAQRVIRGGSWYYFARDCRSASRTPYWPGSGDDIVGFRVARTVR